MGTDALAATREAGIWQEAPAQHTALQKWALCGWHPLHNWVTVTGAAGLSLAAQRPGGPVRPPSGAQEDLRDFLINPA